jgi:hypothetical protein
MEAPTFRGIGGAWEVGAYAQTLGGATQTLTNPDCRRVRVADLAGHRPQADGYWTSSTAPEATVRSHTRPLGRTPTSVVALPYLDADGLAQVPLPAFGDVR